MVAGTTETNVIAQSSNHIVALAARRGNDRDKSMCKEIPPV